MSIHLRLLTCFIVLAAVAAAAAHSLSLAWAGPEVPGRKQARPIAIVGGVIHTVSGPTIQGGVLYFEKGKITKLEARAPAERDPRYRWIDARGKHIYPGLIEANSQLGLVEIGAVRATRDYEETGQINANVVARLSFNPDSELIPVTRSAGVLVAVSAPRGSLMPGTSSVMLLDGWTWEDMTLKSSAGVHVEWPRMTPTSKWWVRESPKKQMEHRDKQLKLLRQAFRDARAYGRAVQAADNGKNDPPRRDARWDALQPVLAGKTPLIVAANEISQIQSAVAFAAKEKVKLIILGGYDAELAAPLLKKHDVPVIIAGVHRLPRRRHDDYDAPFTLAARLKKAGVRFCISGSERFGASNIRNLPHHAATATGHGLSRDEALRAITLYPAQILGVSERVGSLEKGKDATLLIADGDILETTTKVEMAFIAGRQVDLDNRHRRLYRKYREKYRRQAEGDSP